MRIYIASSRKHVGKIQEDIYIRKECIARGAYSEINTLTKIVKIAKPSDIVILKSIWGYHEDYKNFISQISLLKKRKIKLINNYSFIYWGISKFEYLNNIRGVDVIPTSLLKIKNAWTASEITNAVIKISKNFKTSTLVIKPSVSASGNLTYKYNIGKDNSATLTSLLGNKNLDFIVQPYRSSIINGEISIIIIDGNLLYGVIRFPGVLGRKKKVKYLELINIPVPIKSVGVIMKEFFFKKFKTVPNICRIDFLKSPTGYEILEVELIDPDLFFKHIPLNTRKKAISILLEKLPYIG